MPGFDGTGPVGQGPMTGGGRGFCVVPVESMRPRFLGRSFCGRRMGRGFRNRYWRYGLTETRREEFSHTDFNLKQKLYSLIEEVKLLSGQLEDIRKRIEASGKL